jgi:hypothetical protein
MSHKTVTVDEVVLSEVSTWTLHDVEAILASYRDAHAQSGRKIICIVVLREGCGLPTGEIATLLKQHQADLAPIRHSAHYVIRETGSKNTRAKMYAVSNFMMRGTTMTFSTSVRQALRDAPVAPKRDIESILQDFERANFLID